MTMISVPIADPAQIKRLTEFASEVLDLATARGDLELRELVNELHFDLMRLEGDDDG